MGEEQVGRLEAEGLQGACEDGDGLEVEEDQAVEGGDVGGHVGW